MNKKDNILKKIYSLFNKTGFVAIQLVVVAAIAISGAVITGLTFKNSAEKSRDDSLVIMSDDNSFDGKNQIATLVEQVVFYNKDNIGNDGKLENQSKITYVQIPIGGYVDILAGTFPNNTTNKKLKYTAIVNPDIISISDYGLSSTTGYPTFRVQGRPNKAGYAQVKACTTDGGNICSTLNVTVGTPASGISADKSTIILNVDKTTALSVSPIPVDATTQIITWDDTNKKLKNIAYDSATDKLSITGAEAGNTTLVLYLTDEQFGGSIYKKEIQVIVREGINGVILDVENPIADTPEAIAKSWALSRSFKIIASNVVNITIDKYQYYVSDSILSNETLNSVKWKDYSNGKNITDTGRYVYFRACQPKEDVQEHNGESLCGRGFRFVLAVDTTIPSESAIQTYRKDKNGNLPSLEAELKLLGIAKQNGTGEYITTEWNRNVLYDVVTRNDNHSGFNKIEYQLGNSKEDNTNSNISINDENAEWGIYESGAWKVGKWATYNNKAELKDSAWRIRFRVCDKLNNCRSLGSRPYLIDNESPLKYKINGVTTDVNTSWSTSKTISITDAVDRHSGIKKYNYCTKAQISDECHWMPFNNDGSAFGYEGVYIMFQIVDDIGNTYTDGTNYILHVENSEPTIISVDGAATADNAWATSRNFTVNTSKPLSKDLSYYYQISEKENEGYGSFINAGTVNKFNVKNTGRYIKFKICLSKITSICSTVTKPYKLFVDSTKPTINNISGGSTIWSKDKLFTFGITENHSGINRIEYASNTSFTDKIACPDSDKTKCTVKNVSFKQLYFRVYDNQGNVSAVSAAQNAYIDNTPPNNIGAEAGASTTWTKSRTITFSQASDNFTGVNYKYCVSGTDADCSPYNSSKYIDLGTSRSVTVSSGTGRYIYSVACDTSGNCGTPIRSNLHVDNTAPSVVSVSGASTSWATSRTLTLTLADKNSYKSNTPNSTSYTTNQSQVQGFCYVLKYENGSESGEQCISASLGDQGSTTLRLTNNLATQVKIRAKDKAGNYSGYTGWYNIYIQSDFSFSASGSTGWSNAGSRWMSFSSSCKTTTTYSWTDTTSRSTTSGGGSYYVNSGNAVSGATVYANCNGISKSTGVSIYIDRIAPSVWTSVSYWNLNMGWHREAYIGVGSSDSHSGISWQDGTYTISPGSGTNKIYSQNVSRQACDIAGNCASTTATAYHITTDKAHNGLYSACTLNWDSNSYDRIYGYSNADTQVSAIHVGNGTYYAPHKYPGRDYSYTYSNYEKEIMTKNQSRVSHLYSGTYGFTAYANSNGARDGSDFFRGNWYGRMSLINASYSRHTGYLTGFISCVG